MHMLEEHEKAHMHWNRCTEGGMRGKTAFTKLHTQLKSQCKINDENTTEKVPFPQNQKLIFALDKKHWEQKRQRTYSTFSLHTRLF